MRLITPNNFVRSTYNKIMTEEWLPVTIPGCSGYSVSSRSNIRTSNGIIMKPTCQGNITLSGTKGKVRKFVHVISCLAFHGPKPYPTATVDHIDRDWKNNNVINLRWASRSLQARNKDSSLRKGIRVVYKTSTKSVSFKSVLTAARHFGIKNTTLHRWLQRDLTVEVTGGYLQFDKVVPAKNSIVKVVPSWILDDNNKSTAKVSSCGLVLTARGWTTGSKSGRPARYFGTNVGTSTYFVHRLIAAAFFGRPDDPSKIYVNHIDGSGFNNQIANLEWVTPSENSKHAVEAGLTIRQAPVVQYSLNGTRMAEFRSISEAARAVTGIHQNICRACRGKFRSAHNFMWAYKSEAPEHMTPISRGSTSKEVRQYDLHGNLMATFASGRQAAQALGVVAPRITYCCQGKIRLGDFTLQTD